MRVMALDVGEQRIGVALSDPQGVIAQALTVLQRRGQRSDVQTVAALAQNEEAERIVVGLPLSLSGRHGHQAEKVLDFCRRLAEETPLPVETWDERLSTVAAEKALREGKVRREKRRERVDAVAAAIILQAYLDSRRAAQDPSSPSPPPTGPWDVEDCP